MRTDPGFFLIVNYEPSSVKYSSMRSCLQPLFKSYSVMQVAAKRCYYYHVLKENMKDLHQAYCILVRLLLEQDVLSFRYQYPLATTIIVSWGLSLMIFLIFYSFQGPIQRYPGRQPGLATQLN